MKKEVAAIALALATSVCLVIANASASVDRAAKTCGPAPQKMTGKPKLPTKFPTPAKVSYSSSKQAGPTTIVTGFYSNGNLTAIHHAYSKALKTAGYVITHEEQDAADSEVVWKGYTKSGQVKLAKRCDSRILITIPIRPA